VTIRRAGLIALGASLCLGGCIWDDEAAWASRRQIIDAAARCGVPDFKPVEVGDAWAAYAADNIPNHQAKEDCIYADLAAQELLATR
jgi:hypothetical protein